MLNSKMALFQTLGCIAYDKELKIFLLLLGAKKIPAETANFIHIGLAIPILPKTSFRTLTSINLILQRGKTIL